MVNEKIKKDELVINHKEIEEFDIDELLKNKKNTLRMKRIFDVIASGIGIMVLSPMLLIIAILIKMTSEGPVFFKQVRVGKDEVNFKILKFRTMIVDAEKKGMQITVGKDPRITKVGHFLRKTKLDELPQLINVFIGEMSLVGPRPEVPKYVAYYNEEQRKVLKVKPGITDIASIEYRDESEILSKSIDSEKEYIENIMKIKIELNQKYIKEVGVLTDIKLILKTIKICFE